MYGEIWYMMGFIRYPLAFSLCAVVALALWSSFKIFRPGASQDLHTKAWLDAILFWGGFAVICGVLGTLVGIILAAQAIEADGRNLHSNGLGRHQSGPPHVGVRSPDSRVRCSSMVRASVALASSETDFARTSLLTALRPGATEPTLYTISFREWT